MVTWAGDRLGWRESGSEAPSIAEIIAGGESERVEFKSTARWKQKDGNVELAIAKTVAGFLNGQGGTLVIGFDDEGSPLGLDDDLSLMKSADHDRYQVWLTEYLERTLGKPALAFVSVSFASYEGEDVVVSVSTRPTLRSSSTLAQVAEPQTSTSVWATRPEAPHR